MPVVVPLTKALDTNSIQTTFVARTVATSEPGGVGVIDLLSPALGWGMGNAVPARVKLVPFGGTTNDQTYQFRVWGHNKVSGVNAYVPQMLVHMSVSLATIPAGALGTSNYLVDTLVIVAGTSNIDVISSPGGDLPAYLIIRPQSCRWLDFDFDMTGALNGNVLVAPVETP